MYSIFGCVKILLYILYDIYIFADVVYVNIINVYMNIHMFRFQSENRILCYLKKHILWLNIKR